MCQKGWHCCIVNHRNVVIALLNRGTELIAAITGFIETDRVIFPIARFNLTFLTPQRVSHTEINIICLIK